jgi:hypothetical protein
MGIGVPQIIVGGSQEMTEASAKIAFEEAVLAQLNLEIELESPASLENELLSDKRKDGAENMDPSETQATPATPEEVPQQKERGIK